MKKILLTTTALVMTAGVAAAEVSISGTSQVSVSATGNADNVLNTHVDMNIGISGSYDNGMTMAAMVGPWSAIGLSLLTSRMLPGNYKFCSLLMIFDCIFSGFLFVFCCFLSFFRPGPGSARFRPKPGRF